MREAWPGHLRGISGWPEVYGHDYHAGSNVVKAVVWSLRRKLDDHASVVETVHGTGYRLRL